MDQCIFCRIIERRVPARIVFEDDEIVAFEDTNPQAPIHTLIVPRKHLASLKDATPDDAPLLGRLLMVAAQLARERGLEPKEYYII
jgi:histidine triad (HIT) family protein